MPEFWGDETAIARQKRLLARREKLQTMPWTATGGRLLIFVEPSADTWPSVRDWAEEDGALAFVEISRDDAAREIAVGLGDGWDFHAWDSHIGTAERILRASRKVLGSITLPDGWTAHVEANPDDAEVDEIQQLNAATGVSPNPRHALTGQVSPALNVIVRNAERELMATAWAGMIFHPDCRMGDVAYVGFVSVAEAARGHGLGKFANALVLVESQASMVWGRAVEYVDADNHASRGMVRSCGLHQQDGIVAAIAMRGGGRFTR
jgi:Acetyltransferase (GNAT) family